MENEFPVAENEEMPEVEDAIPLVAILVLVEGVMLPSWACSMAPALGRKALEFMIINLVSQNQIKCIRRRCKMINQDTICAALKRL